MSTALDEVVDAADQVADDQRQIARAARVMKRGREQGRTSSEILDRQPPPGIVALLRRSARHLTLTTARFKRLRNWSAGGTAESHDGVDSTSRRLL